MVAAEAVMMVVDLEGFVSWSRGKDAAQGPSWNKFAIATNGDLTHGFDIRSASNVGAVGLTGGTRWPCTGYVCTL